MNLDNVQDVMIEQGCENDEKTSNSSILSVFFQPVNKILQFFAVNRQKMGLNDFHSCTAVFLTIAHQVRLSRVVF